MKSGTAPSRMRTLTLGGVALVVVAAGGYVVATGRVPALGHVASVQAPSAPAAPVETPVPVLTARAARGAVPYTVSVVGNVMPVATVQVRARIDSQLMEALVAEGQDVKRGELLFRLDPRPAQAALAQAEANLERDRAQIAHADADARRNAELLRRGAVSQQQSEMAASAAATLAATVAADRAAVDQARLTLEFTEIRAPIDGVVGAIQLRPGNLVKGDDASSTLTTLVQVSPIHVAFTVPERYVHAIRRAMAGASRPVVRATLADSAVTATGRLVFIDNTVDQQTGTIQLKALFDNKDRGLWPGQFVTVALDLGVEADALTVPAVAVQRGQNGSYVFVVGADGRVDMRAVTVARFADKGAVIAHGVLPGEKVVVEGQMRLTPGTLVEERPTGTEPNGSAPAGDEPSAEARANTRDTKTDKGRAPS